MLNCCSVLDQNITVGLPFRESLWDDFYLAPSVSGLMTAVNVQNECLPRDKWKSKLVLASKLNAAVAGNCNLIHRSNISDFMSSDVF